MLRGRWYAGVQLGCELARVPDWRRAICQQFLQGRCARLTSCHYLHCLPPPTSTSTRIPTPDEMPDSERSEAAVVAVLKEAHGARGASRGTSSTPCLPRAHQDAHTGAHAHTDSQRWRADGDAPSRARTRSRSRSGTRSISRTGKRNARKGGWSRKGEKGHPSRRGRDRAGAGALSPQKDISTRPSPSPRGHRRCDPAVLAQQKQKQKHHNTITSETSTSTARAKHKRRSSSKVDAHSKQVPLSTDRMHAPHRTQ